MKKKLTVWLIVLCMLFGSIETAYADDPAAEAGSGTAAVSESDTAEITEDEQTEAADDGQTEAADTEQSEAADGGQADTAGEEEPETAEDKQPEAAAEEKPEASEEEKTEAAAEEKSETSEEEKTEAAAEEKSEASEEGKTEAADKEKSEASEDKKAETAGDEKPAAQDKEKTDKEEKTAGASDEAEPAAAENDNKESSKEKQKEEEKSAAAADVNACKTHDFNAEGFCTVCGQFVFQDVDADSAAVKYVSWAYKNGIVTGTSSTTFSPKSGCTRIQFVMMLWKMMGSKTVTGVENPFSDVTGSKSVKAIQWALSEGVINSGTTFGPDGVLTRIQIVMILWKLAGSPNLSGNIPFTDVSGSKTTQAVLWAYQNGITKGTAETTFSPDSKCTRLQLVTFLYKYSQLPPPEETGVLTETDTGVSQNIYASGEYSNWEGVSNVSQFTDSAGNYCFAVDKGESATKVTVYITKNGAVKKKISLGKKHPIFGAVTCDGSGNYYMVTGENNEGTDTDTNTVFISKYDSSGAHVKTVGNNGSSSLASYYDPSFYTQNPFSGGNCDAAVNGDYLTVHYARHMYSGHQSDSVWIINTDTMKTVTPSTGYWGFDLYSSHSFAQRAVPFGGGFAYLSEGDYYNRAFTLDVVDLQNNTQTTADIFHFWIAENSSSNMFIVNNNYAHTGDICNIGNGLISHVSTSVKALDAAADEQSEQVFIQILDPSGDLDSASGYKTSGKRSGVSGPYGDEAVTDYGVRWLTDYSTDYYISYAQAVSDGKGNTYVLYELYYEPDYYSSEYKGVYYVQVNKNGGVAVKKNCISKTAYLNPCETPVYTNGTVCWTGNSTESGNMFVYRLKV